MNVKSSPLLLSVLLAILVPISGAISQSEPTMIVTLLGTGSPIPEPDRAGPATLVEAAGLKLLFDVGRTAPVRLAQVNVALGALDRVFITHLHSDHVAGLPDLWLSGFLPMQYGQRKGPLQIVGPPGTTKLAEGLSAAYEVDVRSRLRTSPEAAPTTVISGTEFSQDGLVFEASDVRVTAFRVDHVPGMDCFGYRIDYAGRSVVISGDTTVSENLIKYSAGTDLLIHEVFATQPALLGNIVFRAIARIHVTPQQAGEIFSRVQPRLAAYSHIVLFGTATTPAPTVDEVEAQTRQTYTGPLVIGQDLTQFIVGSEVHSIKLDARQSRAR
jgi:ribonuclease Z